MNDTVKRAVEPGQTLDGRFQIVKRLGKGGVGEVFEVLDLGTHRRRALKLLQHQFTTDLATVEQFKREAAARGIADNHPAIVDVFTIGVLSDGRPFILMELLSGVDLDFYASQRGGKLEVAEAVRAVLVAADAVAAAHEKGLLHRDLKPSNIFRLAADDFRVLDFGMATLLGTLNADTGGTPAFSAPEQWVAFSTLSSRTDVFGLGATLYALIAGVPPIVRACPSAKNPGELIAALLASPKFPPLVEAPASVQAVIARALEPTAANRFRDAREFAEALRAAAPTVVGVAALALAPDAVPQEHEARAAFASTARLQTPNANAVDDVPGVMRRARTLADSYAAELTGVLRALRALGGFEELLTLATSAPHDVSRRAEVRELIGFSQNRLGQQAEAERTLSALLAEAPTGERAGLLARVFKDQYAEAAASGQLVRAHGFLRRAIDAYLQGFELAPDDPYCGINALTLMEALDAEDPRRAALLPRVQRCTQARVASSAAGFWDHAALLELSVLTDDRAVAQSALKQCEARAQSVERWAPLSTARTLAMIARARDAKQVAAGWIRPVVEKLVQLTG